MKFSDSSVRDHRQSAEIKNDLIVVRSYVGRKKASEFTIQVSEWDKTKNYPTLNPHWNTRDLIYKYTDYMDEESGGSEQAVRIRDSMVRAIEKAVENHNVSRSAS